VPSLLLNPTPLTLARGLAIADLNKKTFKFSAMPVIKERKKSEAEATLQKAIYHYRHSDAPSIRALAEKDGVTYSTLGEGCKVGYPTR